MANGCECGCHLKTYLGWCDQYNEDSACPCTVCIVKSMCRLECMNWIEWASKVEKQEDYIGDKKMETNCTKCSNYDGQCNLSYYEAYGTCVFKTLNGREMPAEDRFRF